MLEWLDSLKTALSRGTSVVRDTVERETMALLVGLTAGRTVRDKTGVAIVEPGMVITPEVAERARQAGKLQALLAAAAAASMQDLQERWDQVRRSTAEGQEDAAMATIDEYAMARRYVGRVAVLNVTDVRGTVIIPAGKRLTEEDIQMAREHDLLLAVIHSATQPQVQSAEGQQPEATPREEDTAADPSRRPRLPLVEMPVEEEPAD